MEKSIRRKICNENGNLKFKWSRIWALADLSNSWIIVDLWEDKVWIPWEYLEDRNVINPLYKSIDENLQWQLFDKPKKYWFKILKLTRSNIDDVEDKEFYLKYLQLRDYIRERGGAWYKLTKPIYIFIKQLLCKKKSD